MGPNGEQVGIVRIEDALRLAAESELDLVEVAPTARPPVCKLMDFRKFKYESAVKAREARKNQANTITKEMKLRPKIDPHDYETKKGHVARFLKGGDKVKITIMFRGREQSRPELGYRLLQRLAEDVAELGVVEAAPKQDGRNMIMVLGPTRKKAEARAEREAEKAAGGLDVLDDYYEPEPSKHAHGSADQRVRSIVVEPPTPSDGAELASLGMLVEEAGRPVRVSHRRITSKDVAPVTTGSAPEAASKGAEETPADTGTTDR